MLRKLDRYVLRRVLGTFLPICLGLAFLFFVGASFRLLREADLSIQQVLLALPWVVPFLLPYLLPMALVTTITLVYGRLVADNEVLAFGSLGIPGRALAWPTVVVATLLSLGVAWLTAQLVPYCHRMQKEATRAVFEQMFDLGEGEHLTRSFPKQHLSLYVRRYAPGQLEGVVLHYDRVAGEDGRRRLPIQIVAEEGSVAAPAGGDALVLVLRDVTATVLPDPAALGSEGAAADAAQGPVRVHLDRYVQEIPLGSRGSYKRFDWTSPELRAVALAAERRQLLAAATGGAAGSWEGGSDTRIEAEVELAMRATLSWAPLLVALIALPLTLLLRARSPLVPFAAGLTAVVVLFFTPLLVGSGLAEDFDTARGVYAAIPTSLAGAGALALLALRRG